MELRQDAVLTNPGSYVAIPGSPSTAICFRSAARMVPSVIAISYSRPVRLSRTVSESVMATTYAALIGVNSRASYDPRHHLLAASAARGSKGVVPLALYNLAASAARGSKG